MNANPRISVLMPAYNVEKYVAESIDSVLAQSFSDFELLITDDGSTDGTWDIVQGYALRDVRIKIFRNDKNLGLSPTRNGLIERAKGEYIAWQDADDVSLPYRLERQHNYMSAHPRVGICGGFLEFFNEKGVMSVRRYAPADAELRAAVFRYSPVSQGVAMIRRSALESSELFDMSLSQAEDLDLSLRIGMRYEFANIQEVLLRYRQSGTSISTSRLRENIRQTLIVRTRAKNLYGYKMSAMDRFAYVGTVLFQFVPAGITLGLFNAFRNR